MSYDSAWPLVYAVQIFVKYIQSISEDEQQNVIFAGGMQMDTTT